MRLGSDVAVASKPARNEFEEPLGHDANGPQSMRRGLPGLENGASMRRSCPSDPERLHTSQSQIRKQSPVLVERQFYKHT